MQKHDFLKSSFIATFYIFVGKIIGIIYAIPFHAIIGEKGGALYSYAYKTYNVFLTLSTVGIPFAISKLVSEYNTKGFYRTQKRIYPLSRNIIIIISCIVTLILFLLAPLIAWLTMGKLKDGNTVEDITFVIRVSATALIFVAILGNMRGYLQGNKYISASSGSQVIEQIVRVAVIILGSYSVKSIFKKGLTAAVGIAVFGATVGAFVSILYLKRKISKEPSLKVPVYEISQKERQITNSFLIRQLLVTTAPFIVVSIVDSSYGFINSLVINRTLVNLCGFSTQSAESVQGIIGNWGDKLNSIVTAVAGGITISVLPNITQDMVSQNLDGVRKKINQTLQILLYTTLPMATGLSLLAKPVWNIFYGQSELGHKVFMVNIFVTIFVSLEMNINVIMQSLDKFKTVYISAISGLVLNTILIVPMMYLFNITGLQAYNGVVVSTILGLSLSMFISLKSLKKSHKVKYTQTLRELIICIIAIFAMAAFIIPIKLLIPMDNLSKLTSILIVAIFALIGSAIYISITYSAKTVQHIFGKDMLSKIPLLKNFTKHR